MQTSVGCSPSYSSDRSFRLEYRFKASMSLFIGGSGCEVWVEDFGFLASISNERSSLGVSIRCSTSHLARFFKAWASFFIDLLGRGPVSLLGGSAAIARLVWGLVSLLSASVDIFCCFSFLKTYALNLDRSVVVIVLISIRSFSARVTNLLNSDRSFSVIDLMRFFIVSAFVSVSCWL